MEEIKTKVELNGVAKPRRQVKKRGVPPRAASSVRAKKLVVEDLSENKEEDKTPLWKNEKARKIFHVSLVVLTVTGVAGKILRKHKGKHSDGQGW
jgi:hypothetical protein